MDEWVHEWLSGSTDAGGYRVGEWGRVLVGWLTKVGVMHRAGIRVGWISGGLVMVVVDRAVNLGW